MKRLLLLSFLFSLAGSARSRRRCRAAGRRCASRGNGGFLSTVRELGQWARALDTMNFASAATKARAAEPVIDTGGRPGRKMTYGWFLEQTPQGRLPSHSGGNGIFATNLRRYIDRDVVVVMSTNDHRRNWNPTEQNVAALLFGEAVPMPPEAKGSADAERIAGRYRLPSGREVELRADGGTLLLDPFAAPEIVTMVRPANARSDAKAGELLDEAKKGLEQIAAGKPELLTQGLIPTVPAEGEREFWSGWMTESEKRHANWRGGKAWAKTPVPHGTPTSAPASRFTWKGRGWCWVGCGG